MRQRDWLFYSNDTRDFAIWTGIITTNIEHHAIMSLLTDVWLRVFGQELVAGVGPERSCEYYPISSQFRLAISSRYRKSGS